MTRYLLTLLLMISGMPLVDTQAAEESARVTFDDHVKPILQQKCFACHNPDKKSADLDLTTYANLMQGGASGTVIEPSDSSASYLYELVTHTTEPYMPPESPKIPDEMIEVLRKWIDGGVLENSGSKAKESDRKKYDLALAAPSTERPEVAPVPARLSLQPVVHTTDRTAVDALATSPWAPLVAVSGQRQVLLYDTDSLELCGVLPFPEGTPRVLKFSRNGSLLLAGGGVAGASGRVVVWEIRSGERIIEIGDELDEVLAADISSDQTLIALAGPQRVVRVYATETGQLVYEIRKHTDWVTALAFSPDSVLLATGDRNGGLFVWEGWTGREYLTLKGHGAGITAVSWRTDSNLLASSSEDATIRLWEMENGGQVKNWSAHGGGAMKVEFTRDGRLFSCGRDRVAKLWDQNGGQQVAYETFSDLALEATFCDETGRAISGDWTGEIRIWNATDGARLGKLSMNAPRLEDRIVEAKRSLATRQNEHMPLEKDYHAAQAASDKARANWVAIQQQGAAAKQSVEAAVTARDASKQRVTLLATELRNTKKQVENLKVSVPLLKEAAVKAEAAATQLADDVELVAAAATIKLKASANEQRLADVSQAVSEKLTLLEKVTSDLKSAEKTIVESTATQAEAEQEQQRLMPLAKAAEDVANAAKQEMEKSSNLVAQAEQQVTRWTNELEFTKTLDHLKTKRIEARTVLSQEKQRLGQLEFAAHQAAAVLNDAKTQLTTWQSDLFALKEKYTTALATLQSSQQAESEAALAAKVAEEKRTRLQQIVNKVAETLAKSEEALVIDKDDPSLVAMSTSLRDLVAEKNREWAAAQVDWKAKTKTHQAAIAKVAMDDQASQQTLSLQRPLENKIADQLALLATLAASHEQATNAVQRQTPLVTQAANRLESIGDSIAIAQGIKPAQ